MIGRLILRHEIIHTLTKPLLITVTTVSLILNILAYQMARYESEVLVEGSRAVLAQFAFLIPILVILLMGKADNRCRPWEAGLPLESRSLWGAHLGALVLGFVILMAVAGIAFLGFGSLISLSTDRAIFRWQELMDLITRPAAVSLLVACLVVSWKPQSGRLAEEEGYARMKMGVILGAAGLLGLLVVAPPWFALIPVVAGGLWAWRARTSLPPVIDMGGGNSGSGSPVATDTAWAEVGPSRWVLWYMVLRTLFKWPLSWIALGPIAAAFGILMSGARVLGMHEEYWRFLNFFLAVYILFAMSNHFMENLYKVDHLPLDRRVLLRWMVLPTALFFIVGYGVGRVIEGASDQSHKAMFFENSEDNYGLKVPPDVWELSYSAEPRVATSPWGESHELQAVPVIKGLPLNLWRPYSTPVGSSREFVAWQISRAAAVVYDIDIATEEIVARYLDSDPSGKALVRDGGLSFLADYPQAGIIGSGPVFPVWVGAVFFALMIVNGIFFRAFRPGITIKKSRVVFWFLMVGLMALHIGGYVLLIKGVTREWIVYGFWMGIIRDIGVSGPVGIGAAWIVATLLIGLSWRWAEKSFLKAEAPST